MRIINVKRRKIDLKEYRLRGALESDYDQFVSEPTIVKEGKETKIVYLELGTDCSQITQALKRVQYQSNFRTGALPTISRIFGFSPRITLRRDYCTATSLVREHPQEHQVICDYAKKISEHYKANNADLYAKHGAMVKKVLPSYRIKKSVFTSGIVNKNNPLRYHFDTGNFAGVWSCMLVLKSMIKGGHLSVPEYGIGFKLKNNSLFMFDGQGLLHGVTPILKLSEDAYRFSIVYYSLQQMWRCMPIGAEVDRIRQKRTEREIKRSGIVSKKAR